MSWTAPEAWVEVREETMLALAVCGGRVGACAAGRTRSTHLVQGVGERVAVAKPVLEGDVGLAEVVPVPADELDDAEPVCEGEVDGQVEGGILGRIDGVEGALSGGGVVGFPQEGDYDEAVCG